MKKYIALGCAIVLTIQFTGCDSIQETIQEKKAIQEQKEREKNAVPEEEQAAFKEFTKELFKTEVQSDGITYNYTLNHPENYGITDYKQSLGDFGVDATKEKMAFAENVNKKLDNFVYSALTKEQQITYDALRSCYQVADDDEDYILYAEVLGSTTGIQAELPILFSEYNIDDKTDLDNYLDLLLCVEEYFSQIEKFEQQKSDAGLFMPDNNVDGIVSQCEDFIENPEENLLITIFSSKIKEYDWLTDAEKKKYEKKNKEEVLTSVIPAYQGLIDTLKRLKGTGTYEGGIGNLPNGKTYYEKLAKNTTGSDKSIKEMKQALASTMNIAISEVSKLSAANSKLSDEFYNLKFSLTDPNEILDYLTEAVKNDFPALEKVNYTVKYVDKSLENHVSPAFYLSPQLDNFKNNSIYINGASNTDMSKIFPTLAHEGYPGHLLQTVYEKQHNSDPIRSILNFGGYSEGWATYCENYSYNISGLSKDLGKFAEFYTIFDLCLYAQIDIGVNYDCWSKNDLAKYLKGFGIEDEDTVDKIFNIVTDDPANYLQYVIGYIEFIELRKQAKEILGKDYTPLKFHTYVLDVGEAPFSSLKEHMKEWIDN